MTSFLCLSLVAKATVGWSSFNNLYHSQDDWEPLLAGIYRSWSTHRALRISVCKSKFLNLIVLFGNFTTVCRIFWFFLTER